MQPQRASREDSVKPSELKDCGDRTIQLNWCRVRGLHDDLVHAYGLKPSQSFTHRFRGGNDTLSTASGSFLTKP
jgi:hypothetical protein